MIPSSAFAPLRFARLLLTVQALEPAPLIGFAGPTLRGMLGRALHDTSCIQNEQPAFAEASIYHELFLPTPALETRHGTSAPLILEPPETLFEGITTDQTLEVGLTLVGDACARVPALLWSLFRYGLEGALTSARSRVLLRRAVAQTPAGEVTLFSGRSGPVPAVWEDAWTWTGAEAIEQLRPGLPAFPTRLGLELLTPLDLRLQGTPVEEISFQSLVVSVLRHASTHVALHCGGRLELDFQTLKAAAAEIRTVVDETQSVTLVHRSYRQARDIPRTARLGRLVFEGALEPFIPLLLLGEVLHAGKGRTAGLGGHRWGA